ncbi:ABC transporter ATP-binding protein [Corynebacterium kutscheri]|uniref:ABC transporter ATP-binding protein n=1 Tax=Corynebacterium kutscheri TaxID=35755 RepID=A0A0F6R1N0_9CORY|nr:ABC transporter ATP-binding protein [Corynebacterium kutscheri]AKE41143.1 ABC-type cobalt transport system, ATPase component [Corynebacterium kutscheri]VEH07052.1 ABC transporter ATP-binding protein [Corynebacterium kutscheri]VEH09463.1 ABC transporter ATP-binding protein [Corynebacterium kutscheri]VEH79548.1 ABC transporter ATP-binding protein [Corynebacterium kutscheri]
MPLISLAHVSFAHPNAPSTFQDISIDIHVGDRIALLGANGSGKSTLMKLMCTALRPKTGSVIINDQPSTYTKNDRNRIRSIVQMVLQEPDEQVFCLSVQDDIEFGPRNLGLNDNQVATRCLMAAHATEVSDLLDRIPHQLSYGQRKRVALAGALAMSPQVLLLDEPTAGLDPAGVHRLLSIIKNLDAAVLLATHDVNFAYAFADTWAVLHKGQLSVAAKDKIIADRELLKDARLDLPWAPLVSALIGKKVTFPEEL